MRNIHWVGGGGSIVAGIAFIAVIDPPRWMIAAGHAAEALADSASAAAGRIAGSALEVAPWSPSPDTEWRVASLRLGVAQLEAKKAEERALQRIDEFFAERARASEGFVEEMMGAGSKVSGGMAVVEGLSDELGYQLGLGRSKDPDRMLVVAGSAFRRHVLTYRQTLGAMQSISDDFAAELGSLETRYRADNLPPGIAFGPVAAIRVDAIPGRHVDAAIAAVAEIVKTDAALFVATTVASGMGSDMLTDATATERDGFWSKQAMNFMAGYAIDVALDKALATSGYDPAAKVRGLTWKALRATRDEVVESPNGLRMAFARLRTERAAAIQQTIDRLVPGKPPGEADPYVLSIRP